MNFVGEHERREGDASNSWVLPDYGGACITEVFRNVYRLVQGGPVEDWFPPGVRDAALDGGIERVVVLLLDGLGWNQLQDRLTLVPNLAAMSSARLTTVAPSTTTTALTSLMTGVASARHGIVGYEFMTPFGVLNSVRWAIGGVDAREVFSPSVQDQPIPASLSVVTQESFRGTAFTDVHLRQAPLFGYRDRRGFPQKLSQALETAPVVYAYYVGIDAIAHETGLGGKYEAELQVADQLVADLVAAVPPRTAFFVTSDHGHVVVDGQYVWLDEYVTSHVWAASGEPRFRWLHARGAQGSVFGGGAGGPGAGVVVGGGSGGEPGVGLGVGDTRAVGELAAYCRETYGDKAWVLTQDEVIEAGIFGAEFPDAYRARLGDVALLAKENWAFVVPGLHRDSVVSLHGSLTPNEMYVPLLGCVT